MAARHQAATRACRRLSRQLTVWHRSLWRWKGAGKAFWVQLTFDNRTGRQLGAELTGTAVATGMLVPEDAFEPGTGLLRWGGSSADFAQVPPGVSSQHVTPVGPPELDTNASGTMRITHSELYVWLDLPGEEDYCTVPSRPGP